MAAHTANTGCRGPAAHTPRALSAPGPSPRKAPALSVVIGAGGTGGHIYPGIAVAEALRRAVPDCRVAFIGTERGLETELVPGAGFPLHTVDMIPFDRSLGVRRFGLPADLLRAGAQARGVLRRTGAQVVIGMGGYPSAPAVLGARMGRVPCLVHESNAVPGRANRFAARLTDHVALAFDEAGHELPGGRDRRVVGMPLVESVARLDRAELRARARARFGLPGDCRLVLVNGGSLGATRLTDAAVGLAARWRGREDVRLLIKTGPERHPDVVAELARNGGEKTATAVPYLDRMDLAYAAADVAVCRAGASTVAELTHLGLPSVLVPYPHAPGDHQTRNAGALAASGAALLLPDGETDAAGLEAALGPLLADPARLRTMARLARRDDHARAAESVAAWAVDLATGRTGTPTRPRCSRTAPTPDSTRSHA
ncbi:undecaprenyldiphospho-muramoylpentapeptide beta-N-acetylglucosaminyltransferase [Streptomyces sp. HNM0574]|uniref:undecaprenyldiphospho-muramoylpentapeptide beta-N-acetylglucosaminyltransferase n=1 Tax=Streptomyces sp. HNM0574 TaxID=2714954 RepID=UPI00146AE80E|nr:undecaprenyldiphospho-muramoylpentapeptide beta-N-acetylglucosaminyltransferase [Streptomyces sp. HNM0574]NLU65863.1 undecaprenyldiphospho-muramoylpentapeptide beta-N-acetylglucosaminyltransferase [Streptomyces sp. HNM0574]